MAVAGCGKTAPQESFAARAVAAPEPSGVVHVEHIGPVDLAGADCRDIADSSFVSVICFVPSAGAVVARLGAKNYAFCGMSRGEFEEWVSAQSKGRHFNEEVKGRFGC